MSTPDFSQNVSDVRFIAWDTETTGISAKADHLVEIAAIAFDEEFEHRTFESLVKPPVPIPASATAIHGITNEMVVAAPNAGETLDRFFEFLNWAGQPRFLVAHNAGFDVEFVAENLLRSTCAVDEGTPVEIILDSCMLAKSLLPDLPTHRLGALVEHFKLSEVRFHRAMEDVRALKEVFMKLLGMAADKYGTLTISKIVDLCGGYFILDRKDKKVLKKPFRLPPRIEAIESFCGTETKVPIVYEVEENGYRYVTPIKIRIKGFRVYLEAFCHRDNIKKSFRADKILHVGKPS